MWLPAVVVLSFLLLSCGAGPRDAHPGEVPGPVGGGSDHKLEVDADDAHDGFTLVSPHDINRSFLVDGDGRIVHVWECDSPAQGPSYLLGDGSLLRCMSGTGPRSLGVELLDWNGTVLWDYKPPRPYARHHDIEPLPNGNVLFIVRETYTLQEALAVGRHPSLLNDTFWVDSVIEVRQNGSRGGDIVWRWDPTDHLVQDWDEIYPNYGNVSEHPELLDVNLPAVNTRDWLHLNGVDYNPALDQVMITSRNYNEVWVVDHNTTVEEASGHSGGGHGMGGDILYRWGNPRAYDAGDADDQVLYGPHDGHWIAPGLPGEGNIMVFNNGRNQWDSRPEGKFSTVDEFEPPLNGSGGYDRAPAEAFGPSNLTWRYQDFPPETFFAGSRSGAQRLPDGNTLVSDAPRGRLFVVTPGRAIVWSYFSGPLFKAYRYFPPTLDLPVDLSATEDVPLTLDLSDRIRDPDTAREGLVLAANTTHGSVDGLVIDLVYPEGVTRDVINVSVSDGIFLTHGELVVNVTPVNDPPVLAPLPGLELLEDVPHQLDLGPYIADPDDPVDDLVVTTDSQYVAVRGTVMEAVYPEGVLSDIIQVTVQDGEFEVTGSIHVNVTPVNDPPVVAALPEVLVTEDLTGTLDLTPYLSDADTDLEDLSVTTSSSHATVEGAVVSLTYPEGILHDRVELTVSDGEFQVVAFINVTVRPVDDAPTISPVPGLTVDEDVTERMDMEPYIADVDTAMDDLLLTVDSPYATVEGRTLVLTYPEGILEDSVVVGVSDGNSTTFTTLRVTVRPVNDAPRWTGELRLVATEDVPSMVDLATFMEDPDTDVEDLRVTGGSDHATVVAHGLDLLYPEGVLVDEFQLTLSDGEFDVTATVRVDVTPVNDAPELLEPGVSPGSGEEGTLFTFRVVARDADDGPGDLTVSIVIDGDEHPCEATGSANGTVFTVDLTLEAGDHQYHFTADDGKGGETSTPVSTLSVSEPSSPANGGTGGGDEDSYLLLSILLMAGAALAAAALLLRRRRDSAP